jgi:hypothetical protein
MKRIDIGAVVVRLVGYSREGCVLVVDHAVEAIDGSSDQPTRSGVGVTSGQEHQAEDQGPILDGAVVPAGRHAPTAAASPARPGASSLVKKSKKPSWSGPI